jgi:hypothetical protein
VQLRSISGCSKDWWRARKQWPVIHLVSSPSSGLDLAKKTEDAFPVAKTTSILIDRAKKRKSHKNVVF